MPGSQLAKVITVRNVVQRLRLIRERTGTVRELFTRCLRHRIIYQEFNAVDDVSFTVHSGETVAIVGPNGSGKSTLLKAITGIYKPSSGDIEVSGTIAPLLELGIGMHGELSGRENIALSGLFMGYTREQMRKREQRIIDFADIPDFIDVPVKQYSTGMYLRLAFSVASEVNPDILILDEVLAVGDLAFQEKCFHRLDALREMGKTILLVTHDLDQISRLCDRVLLMERGRLIFDGDTDDALDMYRSPVLAGNTRLSYPPGESPHQLVKMDVHCVE